MKDYLPVLSRTSLFRGFSSKEILNILDILQPVLCSYKKQSILMLYGYCNPKIGIVLSGEVEGLRQVGGTRDFTMMRLGPGGIFGEVLAVSGTESPVTVQAASNCDILLLEYPFAFPAGQPQMQHLHICLQQNLAEEISRKYFALDKRIALLLIHSLRQRIATYLVDLLVQQGEYIALPFDRAGFARHLGCERSALSRELSRMAKDGLLQTSKRQIHITDVARLQTLVQNAEAAL